MGEQRAHPASDSAAHPNRWGAYVTTLLAIAVLTAALTPLRDAAGEMNIGLLYLVLVLLIATRWGWSLGFFASAISYLALDYFFIPPTRHVFYGSPGDVLALLVFFAAASLASALLARAQSGEATARRRQGEIQTLYELSRAIIVEPDSARLLASVCGRIAETAQARGYAVLLPGPAGLTPRVTGGELRQRPLLPQEAALVQRALQKRRITHSGGEPVWRPPWQPAPAQPPALAIGVPLRRPTPDGGVLLLTGVTSPPASGEEFLQLLDAFADEVSLAVERDRLVQLAAHVEAVEETDKLRAALLAAVSHDLRTPLASIKASASCLLDPEIVLDEGTRLELAAVIDQETDRLTGLVSNLLDLSRIESGALRSDVQWHDVRELLDSVTSRLRRTLTEHTLVVEANRQIGEARFDYIQIGQVLTNLIENAAKFAPVGTAIRVSARRLHDGVEFAVEDEGPGIAAEERERVFLKFYRGVQVEGRRPGSGLGLAISKGLVEAHGGAIHVEERSERGARLVFWLPSPAPPPPSYVPDSPEMVAGR